MPQARARFPPRARSTAALFLVASPPQDYWDSTDGGLCNKSAIVDLFATTGPSMLNNSFLCSQSNQAAGCKYEDEIFAEEVLLRINEHDPSVPFFLFWAPHIVHAPLEVPQAYVDKFSAITYKPRQYYMAMVSAARSAAAAAPPPLRRLTARSARSRTGQLPRRPCRPRHCGAQEQGNVGQSAHPLDR